MAKPNKTNPKAVAIQPAPSKPTPITQATAAKPQIAAVPAPAPEKKTADIRTLQNVTHDQISRRAYELFLSRGGEHGHQDEDWRQAERELRLGR